MARDEQCEAGRGKLTQSYLDIRAATEARDRSLREKVMTLEEAAKLVNDGDHIAVGGCTASRTPMAMIWALIRAKKSGLSVSRSITSTEGDFWFASGVCNHILTSWFSQGIVWGISKVMRAYTESNRAQFEEWSHMSIGLRYRAGAMGVPFMPTRSMMGSGVAGLLEDLKEIDCPYTGDKILLIPALNPDVALIHVPRCDAYGNAQIDGLQFMDLDIAMAANKVILTTERIITNDKIRRTPDQTKIPFITVDAVVEVQYGSAPHECYGMYEPFFGHMDAYAAMIKDDPDAGVAEYLDRYYYGPSSWSEYLELIGVEDILDATRRGRSIYDD